jgi:hypothetical protein
MSFSDTIRRSHDWQAPGLILAPPIASDWRIRKTRSESAPAKLTGSTHSDGEPAPEKIPTIGFPRPITPADALDEHSIARLRRFFELLDRWDRERAQPPGGEENGKTDEKGD